MDNVHNQEPFLSSAGISCCLSVNAHSTQSLPRQTLGLFAVLHIHTYAEYVYMHAHEKETKTNLVPVRIFIKVFILTDQDEDTV